MKTNTTVRLVRSRTTRKVYRVLRVYANSIRVTPATSKHGPVFSLSRDQVEGV